MFLKSKLLISTLIALPLSVLSFKALSPTFQANRSASSSISKNVQNDVQEPANEIKASISKNVQNDVKEPANEIKASISKNVQNDVQEPANEIKANTGGTRTRFRRRRSKTIKVARASRRRGLSWRIPWRGATATVSQRWHSDGWGRYRSIDFALPAGTPVVAPVASRVVGFCNAGGNHLAIRLQAVDGTRYSLVHVKSRSVYTNKRYRKGQQIGVIAGNRPWNRCARSTGPHLHMSFPRQNFKLGRYWLSRKHIPRRLAP